MGLWLGIGYGELGRCEGCGLVEEGLVGVVEVLGFGVEG